MSEFLEIDAPAKINLFLALTGKRVDGFNQLISIISKLELKDTLKIRKSGKPGSLALTCPEYPDLETTQNLVAQAIDAWRKESGENMGLEIVLDKKIPLEAGLGGGSSDAVAALLGVNSLSLDPLSEEKLLAIAAKIGSDCPVFLQSGICQVEGRGELVTPLDLPGRCNQEILLFRPPLGHPTGQIFQIFEKIGKYSEEDGVRKKIKQWQSGETALQDFIYNDLEQAVFSKYLYFAPLYEEIRNQFGLHSMLSGSGSASFSLLPQDFDREADLRAMIMDSLGEEVWFCRTRLQS